MGFRRADGTFDYGALTSVTTLGILMTGGLYGLAIRPIENAVASNTSRIKATTTTARRVELTTIRLNTLVESQTETLNRLALAVDKLADRINYREFSDDNH